MSEALQHRAVLMLTLGLHIELSSFLGQNVPCLEGKTDFQILRPLYLAAIISPLILLYPGQTSYNSSNRVALFECVELMRVPSLKKDPLRLRIECSIAQFIVELVTDGVSDFYAKMKTLSNSWYFAFDPAQNYPIPKHVSETYAWLFIDDDKNESSADKPNVTELGMICRTMRELVDGESRGKKGFVGAAGWVKKIVEKGMTAFKHQTGQIESAADEHSVDELSESEDEPVRKEGSRKRKKKSARGRSTIETRKSKRIRIQNNKKQAEPTHVDGETPADSRTPARRRKQNGNSADKDAEIQEDAGDVREIQHAQNINIPSLRNSKNTNEHVREKLPVLQKYYKRGPVNEIANKEKDQYSISVYVNLSYTPSPEQIDDSSSLKINPKKKMGSDDVVHYRRTNFIINKWASMKPELNELETILNRTLEPDEDKFGTFLLEFSKAEWDAKSESEKRNLFASANVAVYGSESDKVCNIREWDREQIGQLIDLTDAREVQDQSIFVQDNPDQRMRSTTVDKFIDGIGKDQRVNLMLDIPLDSGAVKLPTSELDDGRTYIFRNNKEFTWSTKLGMDEVPSLWAIITTESAISTTHIDAGGFATYVQPLLGHKLWFVGESIEKGVGDRENGLSSSLMSFQCVYLKPGDGLYMRPGTPHIVVSLDDCLVVGGHFISSVCYDKSLKAMMLEHYAGTSVTNTEHTRSPLMFFKLLDAHVAAMKLKRHKTSVRFPSCKQLAALMYIVHYMDVLDPELPAMKDITHWQSTTDFDYDFGYAQDLLRDMAKLIERRRRYDRIVRAFASFHSDVYNFIRELNAAYPNTLTALEWPSLITHYWEHVDFEEEDEGADDISDMTISDCDSEEPV